MKTSQASKTAEALRVSEERYRRLFEAARDGILILDNETGMVMDVNSFLIELLGYSREAFLGKKVWELGFFKDIVANQANFAELQQKEYIRYEDKPLETSDGRRIEVEFVSNVYQAGDKKVTQCNIRDMTQRNLAQRTAVRLASIVEFSDDAIIGKDLDGNIQSWNAGAEKIFGFSAAEMAGRPITPLIPAELLDEEHSILEKIKRGESVPHLDTVRLRKDGSRVEVSITVSPIKDQAGNVVGASKVVRDITERKGAEKSLRLQSAALEAAANAIVITDHTGTIQSVNPAFTTLTGYTAQEAVGQNTRFLKSGHQDEAFYRNLWQTISSGHNWSGELTNRRKDGSLYTEEMTITPVRSADGVIARYIAIKQDITGRKRAEEALLKSREEFKELFDDAPIGYHEFDAQGRLTRVNQTELKMLGYNADELLGQFVWSISADPDAARQAVLGKLNGSRPPEKYERTIRRKDGSTIPVQVQDQLVKGDDGAVTGIRTVFQDITERKRAEEKIHQLNSELEQRVIERTAQLEAANKELEAFSYSVSHDLRAPLRAVDGFSKIVLEDYGPQLPEKCRQDLQTIRNGAQKMGELIDDLLMFSRLSRLPLNKQAVLTGRLVRGVLEELKPQRDGRQVDVQLADLPPCQADPALLKQVWVNLISNALKYTGKREAARVEIGCATEKGRNVWFVRDNGTGFDMKYAHKLFGVFQRLHRAEDYEGTGVGLAIVQRVIHRHGGRVWAESAVDCGATFYFTLEGETKP